MSTGTMPWAMVYSISCGTGLEALPRVLVAGAQQDQGDAGGSDGYSQASGVSPPFAAGAAVGGIELLVC